MPTEVTHEEIWKQLRENGALLQHLLLEWGHHKEKVEGAFPLDDRGLPDYGGHKAQHLAIAASDKAMGEYKRAVTTRLLQGAIGLLLTLLTFGIGPAIRDVIGPILGG